jgi:hypothetical protein
LEGKTEITNRSEIQEIEGEILEAARATDIQRIPTYRPIPAANIAEVIGNIGAALAHLASTDSAKLITSEGEAAFNLALKLSPDSLRDLLIKESLTNDSELIIKVKRPDYLGESMWDFKLGDHPIQAKIVDWEWLQNFQDRKVDVGHIADIKALGRQRIYYGFNAEIVYQHNEVLKVLNVITITPPKQSSLLGE